MSRRIVLMMVVAVFLVSACRRQTTIASASPPTSGAEQSGSESTQPGGVELMTIEGVLKPTVEQGGWILATDTEEYLLLSLSSFRDKTWFQEGARLKARGRVDREVLTTFMQGTPFIVSELEPAPTPGSSGEEAR